MELTQRQALLLKAVVELHHATGRPVGSKAIVEHGIVAASPSTVRFELGRLEELGMLEHPHTSAGRVPTDAGYRFYVDQLMDPRIAGRAGRVEPPVASQEPDARIDAALTDCTRWLAEVTGLLVVVTAPRASGAVIRHVEVLQLAPNRIVTVVITAAGDVARHVTTTPGPVDPGLVDWAGAYLNEQVAGLALGERRLRQRLAQPDLSERELAMLSLLSAAFDELDDELQELHVGGSSHELARHGGEVQRVLQLAAMLDERRRLLQALRPLIDRPGAPVHHARHPRGVEISIGLENPLPELKRLSVVGATYGTGARPLGIVGVIGPRSMDYGLAARAVDAVACGLSDLAEHVYAR